MGDILVMREEEEEKGALENTMKWCLLTLQELSVPGLFMKSNASCCFVYRDLLSFHSLHKFRLTVVQNNE